MTARRLMLLTAPLFLLASFAACGDASPTPESNRLAFVTIEDGRSVLVILDLVSDERVIVAMGRRAEDGLVGPDPFSVSPDGERIAFVRGGDSVVSESRLWLINTDGSDEHPLLGEDEPFVRLFPGDQTSPKWSPDGTQIVFTVKDGACPGGGRWQPVGSALRAS